MKKQNALRVSAAIVGAEILFWSALASNAKDCNFEWVANAEVQTRGVTEKYDENCQAVAAPERKPTGATSAPATQTSDSPLQNPAKCVAEWKANQVEIMAHGMTEESYVEQCIASDDVPTAVAPEPKTTAAPAATPK
jgi:hypothetical protein